MSGVEFAVKNGRESETRPWLAAGIDRAAWIIAKKAEMRRTGERAVPTSAAAGPRRARPWGSGNPRIDGLHRDLALVLAARRDGP